VALGNQTFPFLVDTGSTDLWVLQEGWACINDTSNAILPQEACTFGPKTYHPSSTFEPITGEFFGEQLGYGRVSGVLAREDVTIGGATVKGQIVGIANVTVANRPRFGCYWQVRILQLCGKQLKGCQLGGLYRGAQFEGLSEGRHNSGVAP
jgi:hypothetical protein